MAPEIISSISIPPEHRAGQPLRFSLGTRVEVYHARSESCVSVSRTIDDGEWVQATIIAIDYRLSGWCPGFCAAYLARLEVDDRRDSIVVRDDDERCIRSIFDKGAKVAIDGMQNRKDLNGKTATVLKFKVDIGRYRIKLLDGSGEKVAVKGTNLRDADEALFADPSPPPDCAICISPMPRGGVQAVLQMCCGQTICAGCMMAETFIDPFRPCPLCRQPTPENNEKLIEMTRNRIVSGDGNACVALGGYYLEGCRGLPRDIDEGMRIMRQGAGLGSVAAQYNLALAYMYGKGSIEKDPDVAIHFFGQAAKGGHISARSYLGQIEAKAAVGVTEEEERRGLMRRAVMHFLISARAGDDFSLDRVKVGFQAGVVTKDEFAAALRQHKESKDEIKSEARDRASAAYTTTESMANADKLRIPPSV